GAVLAANPAVERLLSAGEPLAALAQLFPRHQPERLAAHLTELKRQGQAATVIPFSRADSPPRWLELHSCAIVGDESLALAVLTDATERYEEELAGRAAIRFYETVCHNLAAGVMVIDSHFTIQRANSAIARFYKTTPEALVGRKCHEVIHRSPTPCSRMGEICPIATSLATGAPFQVVHRHLDADGAPRFIENRVAPLPDPNGTVVSFVAMFNDQTEIRNVQERLEAKTHELERLNQELLAQQEQLAVQAEELKRANFELITLSAAKDEFVSAVSHELRTPLTALRESVALVADGSLGPLNSRQAEFLNLAHRNCCRLTELINDLLDLSKIEAGRLELKPGSFDICRLSAEVCATFASAAAKKGLKLDCPQADRPDGIQVFADERLIRRVLTNLVSNAVKFTDQGEVVVTVAIQSGDAVVTVADTGIGIRKEEQPRIFQKFHQAAGNDGTRPPGTGLGLALAKELVELHQGRIWFESEADRGSKFFFTLPLDNSLARFRLLLSRSCLANQTLGLLLVALADPGRLEPAGAPEALDTIVRLAEHGPFAGCRAQILPETGEVTLTCTCRDADELATRASRLRKLLQGATFTVHGEPVRVRLRMNCLFLKQPAGKTPEELLVELRKGEQDVN
ncbi:MAG: PAS domain-containing sensor histidine kinase, partial [candidate division WOR-3 bacterium]